MSQQFYKIDVTQASIPMLSEQQGRTIITGGVRSTEADAKNIGITYAHNVMPTQYGLRSVGYLQEAEPYAFLHPGSLFKDARVIFGNKKTRIYIAWDSEGLGYVLNVAAKTWRRLYASPIAENFDTNQLTTGTVGGVTYLYYNKVGAFIFDEDINDVRSISFSGLDASAVVGIVASSGYLIAYTDLAIAWSSTLEPTDFVPSQVTGAGGGNVAGIAGAIIFATSNSLGILIYSTANIIAGTYTGSPKFPFKLREVTDSKGGTTLDRVAYEANGEAQFVYTKGGLQAVDSQKATIILPQVTDFLSGRRFEDFDELTGQYEITDLALTDTMRKKIKYISARYLVISYGIDTFTHALVLDTALNRLGKVKIPHTDVFEFIGDQSEIAKETIAFMSESGEVNVIDFSVESDAFGVLVLGKLQYTFTHMIQLLGVEVENIEESALFTLSSQVSLNGKTFTNLPGLLTNSDTNTREYAFRSIAKNHSLVFQGDFHLVSAVARYSVAGRR